MGASDKRQAPRVQHELLVAYKTVGGFVSEWAVNLSQGGLFINTGRPLPVGSAVRVMVNVPGVSFPFDLTGKVVRVEAAEAGGSPGMGVEFTGMDDETRDKLATFVDRL